jgi:hypothetical protein
MGLIRRVLHNNFIVLLRVAIYNHVEKSTGGFYLRRLFKKKNGYPLDLKNPKTFQEKVCWKMVHDRNPLVQIVADKYLLYYYVSEKLGRKTADDLLVNNYNYITQVEQLDDIELPKSFIIKSNQGSYRYHVCKNKEELDMNDLKAKVYRWLNSYQDLLGPQWAYKSRNKVVIVQELLERTDDNPITEFKLYMLNGECMLVHYISDRFGEKSDCFLDNEFNQYSESKGVFDSIGKTILSNHKFNMIEVAEKLSDDFDFIRVDFMIHKNHLYLGELTNYPGSIFGNKIPEKANEKMGDMWKLNLRYWVDNINLIET